MKKIKYLIAVAICLIATAFSACDSKKVEIIPMGEETASIETHEEAIHSVDSLAEAIEENDFIPDAVQKEEHIYVYVCGYVIYPEVYELSSEARVVDAIKAAGGFTENAAVEYLNLASKVSDGQKIYVPSYEEVEELIDSGVNLSDLNKEMRVGIVEADSGIAPGVSSSGLVNINSADVATLMTLPGVGESKANKIIAYRDENGGFSCIEDIMLVGGIKEGLFNKVKDYICVE